MEVAEETTDRRMDVSSPETTKIQMTEDDMVKASPSADAPNAEVGEEIAVRDTVISVDTTDKKTAAKQNSFAAKKTVAQGMMDVALITANANQLRYLIEYQQNSPTFYVILILIIISLILQIAVGVSLIFKGRFDVKGKSKSRSAQLINNYVVAAVFLITIINVFIAAFSITTPTTQPL